MRSFTRFPDSRTGHGCLSPGAVQFPGRCRAPVASDQLERAESKAVARNAEAKACRDQLALMRGTRAAECCQSREHGGSELRHCRYRFGKQEPYQGTEARSPRPTRPAARFDERGALTEDTQGP